MSCNLLCRSQTHGDPPASASSVLGSKVDIPPDSFILLMIDHNLLLVHVHACLHHWVEGSL